MTPPSGAIIARPMIRRACGCVQEFQYYEVDKYRAQRQAKFESTRCPACAAKLIESQRMPPKAEALASLPTGANMMLVRLGDGTWAGRLTAEGTTVESAATSVNGLTAALAQQWSSQRRAK
ncbi:MAG: hypothetical protein ACJ8C4_01770 [Gemmataceae bacterium]